MLRQVAKILESPRFWILFGMNVVVRSVSNQLWGIEDSALSMLVSGFVLALFVEWVFGAVMKGK